MGFVCVGAVAKLLGKEASDDANKYLNEEGLATLISLLRQPVERKLYAYTAEGLSKPSAWVIDTNIANVSCVLITLAHSTTGIGGAAGAYVYTETVPKENIMELSDNVLKFRYSNLIYTYKRLPSYDVIL